MGEPTDEVYRAADRAGYPPGMLTMVDLFAGCGGITRGFTSLTGGDGSRIFDPRFAIDNDLAAATTYAENFATSRQPDHAVLCADIRDVDLDIVPEADVMVGGPPCQGFSQLGLNNPDDPRNQLWTDYLRLVEHVHPAVFVIENVARFAASPEFGFLRARLGESLPEYRWSDWAVLNATDFGVPQSRKRAFFVASRVGPVAFSELIELGKSEEDVGAPRWRSVREALEGLDWRIDPNHTELPDTSTDGVLPGTKVPGVFKESDLHITRRPTERSLDRFRAVAPGRGRLHLPDHLKTAGWKKKKTGTTDVMGRLRWDEPSVTIRTEFYKPEKGRYLHPQYEISAETGEVDESRTALRPLSWAEGARLQSFDDNHRWCGTKVDIARQIGNAVPVTLAAYVGKWVAGIVERG